MEEWSRQELEQHLKNDESFFLYLYTPFCGTCQVSGRMLEIVEEMVPEMRVGKCNLNFFPEYAQVWKIESVPCLAVFHKGRIGEKIYAFRSVPYLYEKVKTLMSRFK
ncbi:MAG: thioredoxin family protein [Bacillales bacterium]